MLNTLNMLVKIESEIRGSYVQFIGETKTYFILLIFRESLHFDQ